jgi:hypothetical protein
MSRIVTVTENTTSLPPVQFLAVTFSSHNLECTARIRCILLEPWLAVNKDERPWRTETSRYDISAAPGGRSRRNQQRRAPTASGM